MKIVVGSAFADVAGSSGNLMLRRMYPEQIDVRLARNKPLLKGAIPMLNGLAAVFFHYSHQPPGRAGSNLSFRSR